MTISTASWQRYLQALNRINTKAHDAMLDYISLFGMPQTADELYEAIFAAFNVSTKYGEAAATLAAQWYDYYAKMAGLTVPAAEPAATATYEEVAKTVTGVLNQSKNENVIAGAVERLVKTAGVDTTLRNSIRDGAEVAWIPHGDTCAFCLALASRGWQPASPRLIRNGHAEHVHANCDCTYAVRFDDSTEVAGYDPDAYLAIYDAAPGRNSTDKINAMRREFYAQNRERIRAQQADAYKKRMELNSSRAEETDV